MALNTTATLSVDTTFQQQDTSANSTDNRTGSISYTQSLTSGTGSLEIDAVYNIQDYALPSGETLSINFNSVAQPIVGGSISLSFNNIKSFAIHNSATSVGEDVKVAATGSNPLTEPFNGGAGNLLVKPSSSYIYSDPYTGATVDSSNRNIHISNQGTGTINLTVVAVGVTG
jgi:hypothetical protein|tara:strand:- start:3469 stop:3984 length:516 start_codon:yes stop_codon:yes gene_type:complete